MCIFLNFSENLIKVMADKMATEGYLDAGYGYLFTF